MLKPSKKPAGAKEQQVRDLKLAKHHQMMVEDGAPPELCRLPGEKKAEVATQALAEVETRAGDALSPLERAIREDADVLWRNWTPTAKDLTRPRLASFVKRVREERKKAAKAAKIETPKAPAKPAPQQQEKTMITKTKTAKKAKAKKPAKASARGPAKAATKAGQNWKPGTIGAIAREAILAGKTNEEALAEVKKKFPDGATNVGNMSWYRNDLRTKGLLPKAA